MQQEEKFQDRAEYLQSHTQTGGFTLNRKMKPSDRLRNELQHLRVSLQHTYQQNCFLSHPEHTK